MDRKAGSQKCRIRSGDRDRKSEDEKRDASPNPKEVQ